MGDEEANNEKNDFRDWARLHDYLLEKVIGRLPIADCLSFGNVCKPWEIIAANFLVKCDRDVPCFVKRGQNEVTIRSCFSVVVNSEFKMELPEAYERCIFGSFRDWLFLGKKEKGRLKISLLNPFTGENIALPRVPSIFFLMVVSAVPSNEKCVCMLVSHGHIAFWIPGAWEWHEVGVGPYNFLDAIYYSGCFYLLGDACTRVVVINEKNVLSMLDTGASEVLTQSFSVKLPVAPESERARYYLVESRGEILLVTRFFYTDDARRDETSAFEIFKLDFCKMAWLKLENLDDQILFVGSGCSKSFYVEDLGGSFANRVYFINQGQSSHINEWHIAFKHYHCRNDIDDWGFFSFQKQNHWPTVFQAIPKPWAGVWLSAPIGWCLKQMRR